MRTQTGIGRAPSVSVSRSIFALLTDTGRAYFSRDRGGDSIDVIDDTRAVSWPIL
jgi:hypothetical protein